MSEITLKLDDKASESIKSLMYHYGVNTEAEVIKKGLSLLEISAYIDNTEGELLARKGAHETKIIVR